MAILLEAGERDDVSYNEVEEFFIDSDKRPLTIDTASIGRLEKFCVSFRVLPIPQWVRKLIFNFISAILFVMVMIFYLLFMISCLVSRTSLLSMTSQLEPNHTAYCVKNPETNDMMRVELVQSEDERIMWIWCILISFIIPEMMNAGGCMFKIKSRPSLFQLLLVLIPETLHVIGVAIMVFVILPDIDLIRFWLLCIWFIFDMGLINLFTRCGNNKASRRNTVMIVFDCLMLVNLAVINTVFSVHESTFYDNSFWVIMFACFCISCGFWQDYSYSILSPTGHLKFFNDMREKIFPTRHFIFAVISIWKIVVFFITSITIFYIKSYDIGNILTRFGQSFGEHNITLIEDVNKQEVYSNGTTISLETATSIKDGSLSFTVMILVVQVLLSTISNIEDEKGTLRMLYSFDFRSRIGWNVPLSFSCALLIWTYYIMEPLCNLDHQSVIPRYLSFDSRERRLRKELDVHNEPFSETWKISGSIVSILWIGSYTIARYYRVLLENKKRIRSPFQQPVFNRLLSISRLNESENFDVDKELMTFEKQQRIHLESMYQ